MAQSRAFSPSYETARQRFRTAAEALGARLSTFPIAAPGPTGEALTIDLVRIGAPQPQRVVVISSGLHGVEGFCGSAMQTAWLEARQQSGQGLPDGTSVVLLHALNPYGFAWRRRVNEHNVDLNRNFLLRGEAYAGAPPAARALHWFITPSTPPARFSLFWPQAICLLLWYGMQTLQEALTQGQHAFSDGLFFGGHQPEEPTVLVQSHFVSWIGAASHVLHLDVHSGLGRFATCALLSVEPADSPRGRWLAARFGRRVETVGAGVAARTVVRGSMAHWLSATLAQSGRVYAFLGPEFGTYPGVRVFGALREENRAHRFPDHPAYDRTKERLVEMFCPQSARWRDAVVATGLALIDRAVQVCQDDVWESAPADSP